MDPGEEPLEPDSGRGKPGLDKRLVPQGAQATRRSSVPSVLSERAQRYEPGRLRAPSAAGPRSFLDSPLMTTPFDGPQPTLGPREFIQTLRAIQRTGFREGRHIHAAKEVWRCSVAS